MEFVAAPAAAAAAESVQEGQQPLSTGEDVRGTSQASTGLAFVPAETAPASTASGLAFVPADAAASPGVGQSPKPRVRGVSVPTGKKQEQKQRVGEKKGRRSVFSRLRGGNRASKSKKAPRPPSMSREEEEQRHQHRQITPSPSSSAMPKVVEEQKPAGGGPESRGELDKESTGDEDTAQEKAADKSADSIATTAAPSPNSESNEAPDSEKLENTDEHGQRGSTAASREEIVVDDESKEDDVSGTAEEVASPRAAKQAQEKEKSVGADQKQAEESQQKGDAKENESKKTSVNEKKSSKDNDKDQEPKDEEDEDFEPVLGLDDHIKCDQVSRPVRSNHGLQILITHLLRVLPGRKIQVRKCEWHLSQPLRIYADAGQRLFRHRDASTPQKDR